MPPFVGDLDSFFPGKKTIPGGGIKDRILIKKVASTHLEKYESHWEIVSHIYIMEK